MGGTSNKPAKGPRVKDDGQKPTSKKVENDDEEDGDIATPKHDRTGEDDQPI